MNIDNLDLTGAQNPYNNYIEPILVNPQMYDYNSYLNNDIINVIEEENDLKYNKYIYEYNMANSNNTNTKNTQNLDGLNNLVKAGKVKYIGISNETAWGTSQYLKSAELKKNAKIVSIQNAYNFLNRSFEVGLSEIAIREKVGLLAYSPLASGYLSGKYRNGKMPRNSRMDLFYDFWPRYRTFNSEKAIEEYWNLAKEFNLNLAQMAIKFCEIQPFITAAIIGATTMEQLKTNIDSVNINLDKELITKIGEIHKKYPNPCP